VSDERINHVNDQMHILTARLEGTMAAVEGLDRDVLNLAESILKLTRHAAAMAETLAPIMIAVKAAAEQGRDDEQ